MLSPGDILSGRYQIKKILGSGGMGAVYLASDVRLPRFWAVKEMADHFTDPKDRELAEESFQAEATLLSELNHPNLPRIVDSWKDKDRHYLVMDYIEGETLEDRLKKGPLQIDEALDLATQIAETLHYLHTRNKPVIFRDLKPGNIIMTPDGTAKLIDFGIARVFRQGAASDTRALGTPGYAAPEQYGKGQSDVRTDLFALGATLHHALSGKDPSDAPFQFASMRGDRPEIPEALEKMVLKAVSLKPEDRFQSAREFKSALEALKQDPEAFQHLPASLRTQPLSPPITEGFQPAGVRLGKLNYGQSSRVQVILRGDVKGKLVSDANWLVPKPAKVNGKDPSVTVLVDTSRLGDGGQFSGTISLKGTPQVTPLRVEMEVTPRKVGAWAFVAAVFLMLGGFVPVLGLLTTLFLKFMVWSAPKPQRRPFVAFFWISLCATLGWAAFIGVMWGIFQVDWAHLFNR